MNSSGLSSIPFPSAPPNFQTYCVCPFQLSSFPRKHWGGGGGGQYAWETPVAPSSPLWVTAFNLFRCKLTSEYMATLLTFTATAIPASAELPLICTSNPGRADGGRISPAPPPTQAPKSASIACDGSPDICPRPMRHLWKNSIYDIFSWWSREEEYRKREGEKREMEASWFVIEMSQRGPGETWNFYLLLSSQRQSGYRSPHSPTTPLLQELPQAGTSGTQILVVKVAGATSCPDIDLMEQEALQIYNQITTLELCACYANVMTFCSKSIFPGLEISFLECFV